MIPGYTDISLYGICKEICKFVENTSDKMRLGFGLQDLNVEFLIGGLCPKNQRIMVYRIEIVDKTDHFESKCYEVLTNENDMVIMGSGKQLAEKIISSKGIEPVYQLLKVLREVCKDSTVLSVGGYLQFGQFIDNDFKIEGVLDYEIDASGELERLCTYRGTILYRGKFENDENDFHINCTFVMPFEDEIQEYGRKRGI
jgi:hypothetical protein